MNSGHSGEAPRREAAILIVDDAAANLELLRKIMVAQGYHAFVANSGPRALEVAQRVQPDLILLDVVMPGMDGFETCRQLKQNEATRRIPIIFMSARTDTEDVVAGFDIGGVDYISKPLRLAEVCARVRTQLQLHSQNDSTQDDAEQLRGIVHNMAEGLLIIEADGRIQYANPACERYLGYGDSALAGRSFGDLLSPALAREYLDYFDLHATLRSNPHSTREVTLNCRDGATVCMDLTLTSMYLRQPLYIGLLHDITRHKQSEHALQRAAYLDPLTQIANRRHFDQFLDHEWQRAVRSGAPLSLVVLDVDHFKLYNDTLGHSAGDACLQAVAQAIGAHALRSTDLAARYGGEEFVLLFAETDSAAALLLAEAIRAHVVGLQLPHPGSPTSPWLTVSIGVATILPHPLGDREQLFVAADRAMYVAKDGGRNQVRCTDSGSAAWNTVKALVMR